MGGRAPWYDAFDQARAQLSRFHVLSNRYSRAAQCYEEAGRGQAAAEALSKGARAVEESDPQVRAVLGDA